jgi:hypothetical protein
LARGEAGAGGEAGGRPVIAIVGSTASANLDDSGRNLVIAVGFDFRNIGGLSARELRVRLAAGPGRQPEVSRIAEDFRLANTIHPSTGFSRSLRVQTPVRVCQDGQAVVATQPVDILVRLSYADDGGQLYGEDFYMSYVTGQTQASHAAMEVKEALEARVTEVFAEAAKQ